MTRYELLFATMRRWRVVNLCLDSMHPIKREIVVELFEGKQSVRELATKHKITQERVRQIRESELKLLTDMLVPNETETLNGMPTTQH
jgi:hypothetical protein